MVYIDAYGKDELDDMVHEAKSVEATEINNSGKQAQIDYLLSVGWLE